MCITVGQTLGMQAFRLSRATFVKKVCMKFKYVNRSIALHFYTLSAWKRFAHLVQRLLQAIRAPRYAMIVVIATNGLGLNKPPSADDIGNRNGECANGIVKVRLMVLCMVQWKNTKCITKWWMNEFIQPILYSIIRHWSCSISPTPPPKKKKKCWGHYPTVFSFELDYYIHCIDQSFKENSLQSIVQNITRLFNSFYTRGGGGGTCVLPTHVHPPLPWCASHHVTLTPQNAVTRANYSVF